MANRRTRISMEVAFTVCLAIFAGLLYVGMQKGHKLANRQFKLTDNNISHIYDLHQTYPTVWFVLAWFVIAGIIFGMDYLRSRTFKYPFITAWTFIQLIVITLLFTTIGKVMFARLRPDFIDRCFGLKNVAIGDVPEPLLVGGWYSTRQCNNPFSSFVLDGRVSFPSGHSSLAALFATVLSVYVFYYWRHIITFSGLFIFVSTVWCWAIWVIASRTFNYRHHPGDVIAGALIGLIIGGVFPYLCELNRAKIFASDFIVTPDKKVEVDEIAIEQ